MNTGSTGQRESTGGRCSTPFRNVSLGLAATAAIAEQVKAAPSEETKAEELEPFKYDIESEKGWVGPGGSAKEATVKQLPVSQSIAGVSMRLEPGAIRELHWHALAAEWAYVLAGRCRTTVITPNGQAEVDDFEEGDTWYFPRGHGHAIQASARANAIFCWDSIMGTSPNSERSASPTGSRARPAMFWRGI